MRVKAQFQGVRQNDQVQAGVREWQSLVIGEEQGPVQCKVTWPRIARHKFMGHTVSTQSITLGKTKLQGMKAKSVRHRTVKMLLFPSQHVLPWRRLEPFVQTIGF